MSKSGVNTGFAKCFILFMAIVILAQGIIYLGLAIWGITQDNCSQETYNLSEKPFQFALDIVYFMSEKCGDPKVTTNAPQVGDIDLTVEWGVSYMVTNRMYIFMIVYAVISGLWVVASLLVIATICGPVTKLVSAICFWPWFLVVIAGSILDVVATGFHIHDIVHTTSVEKTFDYVGIESPDANFIEYLNNFDAYFITPAVIMTCVSSRVVIIWLLNIFGTSFCLSLSRVLANQNKKAKQQHAHQKAVITATAQTPIHATSAPYAPALTAQQVEYNNQPTNRPPPLIIPAAAMPQTPRQQLSSPGNYGQQANAPPLTPEVILVENVVRSPEANRPMSPMVHTDDITYRKTDSHPDRLDYPIKSQSQQPNVMAKSPNAQLSTGSVLNNRYSTAEGLYSPSSNAGQQRVSEELRSQLPWSYTSRATKPQPPKKPQPQVQTYPEIPEPDYNFQANQRAGNTGVVNDVPNSQQAYSRW